MRRRFESSIFRMSKKFRKKTIIEAEQFTGLPEFDKVIAFIGQTEADPDAFFKVTGDGRVWQAEVYDKLHDSWIKIEVGGWVVRGVQGEYYPIDEHVLASSYHEVIE